jgi:hypothetical protein
MPVCSETIARRAANSSLKCSTHYLQDKFVVLCKH